MNLNELKKMFSEVYDMYSYTRGHNYRPSDLACMMVARYGMSKSKEFCRVYCMGLPNDGRIYPEMRKYLEDTPVDGSINRNNAYLMGNLVNIHPTHMNQLILSLFETERSILLATGNTNELS